VVLQLIDPLSYAYSNAICSVEAVEEPVNSVKNTAMLFGAKVDEAPVSKYSVVVAVPAVIKVSELVAVVEDTT